MDFGDARVERDALDVAAAQMTNARVRGRDNHGRERGREDEAGAVRADQIDQACRTGDVPAHRADGLAKRALHDVDLALESFTRHDSGALGPVHANGVHLVDKRERVVALGDIGELGNRGDVAVHGVDRLERHDTRARRILIAEQLLEVRGIVVAEDPDGRATAAHALDHRVVILGVRVDDALGQHAAEHGEGGEVGDPAGRKQQAGLLAVPVGKLALERNVHRCGPGDVACAATAGAVRRGRGDGLDHRGVGGHTEVVVGTPDGDRAGRPVGVVQHRAGRAGDALDLRKGAVAPLGLQTLDRVIDDAGVVHARHSSPTR